MSEEKARAQSSISVLVRPAQDSKLTTSLQTTRVRGFKSRPSTERRETDRQIDREREREREKEKEEEREFDCTVLDKKAY